MALGSLFPAAGMRMRRTMILIALGVASSGCAVLLGDGNSGGQITLQSEIDAQVVYGSRFASGIYRFTDANHFTAILIDGQPENPAQVLTLRVFWKPRAGKTPIDATATNATMHYTVFDGDEVGVYSGAGYIYIKSKPGGPILRASIWEAHLRLTDRSDGFEDRLGQSVLKGKFNARRDDLHARQLLHRINAFIHDHLGYPRMVEAVRRPKSQVQGPSISGRKERSAASASADL